ncbi:MAG: alanine racemase [Bacteroidales bacterium]|jgi:D-serine deaminase-like pyridoxal phosphate-dependent protein|nr:alanine racemase [Bacteroidales bacterium]
MNLENIVSPTLILNKKKCLSNIRLMSEKAKKHNLIFRPHFKTHQSRIIGRWIKKFGVNKITVSSLQMAEYFSNDDWKDITVAFPVNIREIETINSLAEETQLNLTLENIESVEFLSKELKYEVGFFIKIDTGYGRTGISFDIFLLIDKILKLASASDKFVFKGFLSHSGNTYNTKNTNEIIDIHKDAIYKLSLLKKQYIDKYPELIMSIGDTPSCSLADDFSEINEIRPGNFVFYDLTQNKLGSCNFDQIATIVTCPVVAKHKNRKEIIIHGGGIHFSKEYLTIEDKKIFGQLVILDEKGWKRLDDDFYLTKLSQEHGTLQVSDSILNKINIGDLVGIIPVHSCLTANLMKEYLSTDDEIIDHLSGNLK